MATSEPLHNDPWIAEAARLMRERVPELRVSDVIESAATMRHHWSALTPLEAVTCYMTPVLRGPGDVSVAELLRAIATAN